MKWKVKSFDELTLKELYALLALRNEVFILEQQCPYQDVDGKDEHCHHVLGYQDDVLVAYCRIVAPNISYKEASIGRVLVREGNRKQHLGNALLKTALDYAHKQLNIKDIRISAQYYLVSFYQAFGFVVCSEVYLEDDIEHIEMFLKVL